MLLPEWSVVGLVAVSIGVAGTFFDKYLLEKYFNSEDEADDGGPGALMIFSSYFASIVALAIFLFYHSRIEFALGTGMAGLFAGALFAIWGFLYLEAINRVELSRVVPLLQTIPAFSLLIAFVTLGEILTLEQVLAMLGLILGAIVLLYTKEENCFRLDGTTLCIMLGVSLLTALSDTIFKAVALTSNYASAAFWSWCGFVLFGISLYLFSSHYRSQFELLTRERFGEKFTLNSLNEIFDNLHELLFFLAITLGPIALVHSINAYEPILVLVVGFLMAALAPRYFKEDNSGSVVIYKIFGVLVITVASVYLYSVT